MSPCEKIEKKTWTTVYFAAQLIGISAAQSSKRYDQYCLDGALVEKEICSQGDEHWGKAMVRRSGFLGWLVLVVTLANPVQGNAGAVHLCGGAPFAVSAPSPELAQEVCQGLTEAAEMMSTCGLIQTRPISVEVVDSISHPIGECLSYLDCEFDTITVTDPGTFGKILKPDNPYSQFPPLVLLRALLIHELAHALVHQNAGSHRIDIVDQEYIAAALELELLTKEWREVLLEASPVSLPPKPGLIDIWIYGLAPRKFATNAWQHFRQNGNGCDLVMRIVDGRFSFR